MFELGTFIFSIIAFLLMFWIVSHFGFKPIARMLEQRRAHVTSQIEDAEKGRLEAEAILAEQRRLLEEAKNEARAIMDAARARADEQAQQLIHAAQAESERVLADGRELIERERNEALASVMDQVAKLTVELTTKLLQNHVTEQLQQDMLAEAEKRIGELV
ncbi:F0F1 ATP synthase subunit B [Alicyclobacillus ferrooxydans]|uniref:ATP synthase subunit b n=1 Tax=Alicyclobacillus ferrooxydans TaxID=471514 RepID=A0A0P9D045_9BACL|nr:F0F1 ATP synthase subunit B [Alicyclobacillus ferrooxydans]KPV42818.1 ATP synthase F0 subunit B [Alicyclobacillus ferrooxydans]